MSRVLILIWVAAAWVATHERARVWHDEVALWTDAVAQAPLAPRPTINLARAAELAGDPGRARALSADALRLARRHSDFSDQRRTQWLVVALENDARFRLADSETARPLEELTEALHLSPNDRLAQYEYQIVMLRLGRCQATEETDVWRCPRIPPDLVEAGVSPDSSLSP